jgi:hypothetical protein
VLDLPDELISGGAGEERLRVVVAPFSVVLADSAPAAPAVSAGAVSEQISSMWQSVFRTSAIDRQFVVKPVPEKYALIARFLFVMIIIVIDF